MSQGVLKAFDLVCIGGQRNNFEEEPLLHISYGVVITLNRRQTSPLAASRRHSANGG